jgi:hypothetical protein
MPSAQEIASKLAQTSAWLNMGGTNAQMKEWYNEYKQLVEELKAAKAVQTTAPKTTCHAVQTTAPMTTCHTAQTIAPKTTCHSDPDDT